MSAPNEAGRELDALIAERVMGYRWARFNYPPAGWSGGLLSPWRWLVSSMPEWFVPARGDETRHIENVPRYSTDIAAAFLVVEKMRADGWGFVLNSVGAHGARAFFTKGERFAGEDADTTPHAICLAALAALEATPSSQETRKENRE